MNNTKRTGLNIFELLKVIGMLQIELTQVRLVGPYSTTHYRDVFDDEHPQESPIDILIRVNEYKSKEEQERLKRNVKTACIEVWGEREYRITLISDEDYNIESIDVMTIDYEDRTEREKILCFAYVCSLPYFGKNSDMNMPEGFDIDEFVRENSDKYEFTQSELNRFHKHKEEILSGKDTIRCNVGE